MKKKRTKNPVIWFGYLCWNIQFWMLTHVPYYPMWLRRIILTRTAKERHGLSWRMIRFWESNNPDYEPHYKPLPWFIGPYAIGPFKRPWMRIARFFRRFTGGRSHRCEFTDREKGALYGGKEGPFMDRLFEQFIQNIPD